MMSEWKQAWSVALLEMRTNKKGYLLIAFFAAIYLFVIMLMSIERVNTFLIDLFMILLVWVPMLMRGKAYTAQKLENGLYASRFVILLSQFPISKKVIIKSRFILTFLFNVCLNALLLSILYFSVEAFNRQLLGIAVIIFILIWLCVGYQTGAMIPASEIGKTYTPFKLIFFSIYLYGSLAIIIFIFHVFLKMSIVEWTIYLANEQQVITMISLFVIMVLTHIYGKYEAKKAIDWVDYYL